MVFQIVSDKFIRVQFRRVRRQYKQSKFSFCAIYEFFYFIGFVRWMTIDDQKYWIFRVVDKSFQKLNEFPSVEPAFNRHKAQFASGTDGRNHIHTEPCPGGFDDGRQPFRGPCRATVKIRAHAGFITKVDLGLGLSGQRFFWKLALQPLLHKIRILLVGPMQRILRRQTHFLKQSTNRYQTQFNTELILDQVAHHITRPQSKFKLELQGILRGDNIVDLFNLLAIEFLWSTAKRFGLKGLGAAFPVPALGKPLIDTESVETQLLYNLSGTVPLFHKFYGADAHFLSCFVV